MKCGRPKKHRADSVYDPIQLRRGIKDEMEHTCDPEEAKETAKDHLDIHPLFYDYDAAMRRRMKRGEAPNPLRLFHGTTQESATELLARGWKPTTGYGGGNLGQAKYLYVTTDPENARWFAEEKGDDAVLEIVGVPLSALIPDPEDSTYDSVAEELAASARTGMPASLAITQPLKASQFKAAHMKRGVAPNPGYAEVTVTDGVSEVMIHINIDTGEPIKIYGYAEEWVGGDSDMDDQTTMYRAGNWRVGEKNKLFADYVGDKVKLARQLTKWFTGDEDDAKWMRLMKRWLAAKKRGAGENPPLPVTMPELYHLNAELRAIEETDHPNDLLWVEFRGKIEAAAKRPVDTDATAVFFDTMLTRFNAIVKKRSSAHAAAQASAPIGTREWNELVNLRMQAFGPEALRRAGSKFKKIFKAWSGRPFDASLIAGFKGGEAEMNKYVDATLRSLAEVGIIITARQAKDNPPAHLVSEAERIIHKLEAGR